MATVLRVGSSGSKVNSLQESLNAAGYKPKLAVDGVYGPKTKAAVLWYQKRNNLTVDGIAGSQTLGSLGGGAGTSSSSSSGTSGGDTSTTTNKPLTGLADYTDPEETRFNGLPGTPELWKEKDSGKVFAVYYVPNSKPPIPILYVVPDTDSLESLFGEKTPKFDRTISSKDIDSFGSIRWGTTHGIPASGGDPWVGFVEEMDRAKETQPWLDDAEVFAVFTAAWLEGREPERFELEATDWWQSRTEAEQEWQWLVARNPVEANQRTEENYIKTYEAFVALGLETVSDEVVTFMSNRYTQGQWTNEHLSNQIEALFNPNMVKDIDEGLAKLLRDKKIDLSAPSLGVTDVKASWAKWLGPAYPPTDAQVTDWAAKIRRGGEGEQDALTEYLRSQRIAMYPGYENPDLTYEDIAGPWRGFATNAWGTQMDETSDTFQQLVKLNDSVEGGKLLRKEGLKQNIGAVIDSAGTGLLKQTSGVRRAV